MTTLRIAHLLDSCRTLGPGRRAIVWVAGCPKRCPGCIASSILDERAGRDVEIDELVERFAGGPAEGVTFSGGEPFEQARALARLCSELKGVRDFSFLAFSGFELAELESSRDPAVAELLAHLDILVDAPFVEAERADLLWRGSRNQTVHFLTDRHRDVASLVDGPSAGLELHLRRDGGLFWAGIPEPGFDRDLKLALERRGVDVATREGGWL